MATSITGILTLAISILFRGLAEMVCPATSNSNSTICAAAVSLGLNMNGGAYIGDRNRVGQGLSAYLIFYAFLLSYYKCHLLLPKNVRLFRKKIKITTVQKVSDFQSQKNRCGRRDVEVEMRANSAVEMRPAKPAVELLSAK